jgi:hypothetical protein
MKIKTPPLWGGGFRKKFTITFQFFTLDRLYIFIYNFNTHLWAYNPLY